MTVLLYGANGYTGRLIADRAHRTGQRLVLAGRREESVVPLAERYGFDYRVFGLESPAKIAKSLSGVTAVLLAAGPFSRTSAPMLEACLTARVSYLDITGEISVFEQCFAQQERVRSAGIAVLPGVGFDVVPSDCLAATLAAALPGATSLELAFTSSGGRGPQVSRGTARTMVEGMGQGGAIREHGVIRRVPLGWRSRAIPFHHGVRTSVSIPWGDVSTAFYSTRIPNIVVYTAMSRRQIRALRIARYLAPISQIGAVQRFLHRRIDRAAPGPDENARNSAQAQLWGRVTDASGRSVEGTLTTVEGYRLTAETALESARRVDAGLVQPGVHTPSLAFGASYIMEFDGSELRVD